MNLKLGASFWSKKCRMLSEKISRRAFSKNSVQKKEQSCCFFNSMDSRPNQNSGFFDSIFIIRRGVTEGYHGTMCRWQTNEQVFTRVKKINPAPLYSRQTLLPPDWTRTGIWNEIYDRLPGDMAVRMREVLAGCGLVILVPRVTRLTL